MLLLKIKEKKISMIKSHVLGCSRIFLKANFSARTMRTISIKIPPIMSTICDNEDITYSQRAFVDGL